MISSLAPISAQIRIFNKKGSIRRHQGKGETIEMWNDGAHTAFVQRHLPGPAFLREEVYVLQPTSMKSSDRGQRKRGMSMKKGRKKKYTVEK